MAKNIYISFPAVGIADSEANYLAKTAGRVFTAMTAAKGIGPIMGSPMRGMRGLILDADVSQDMANAMAQGVKDSGGPSTGYHAFEVAGTGVITALADPAPM